MLDAHRLNVFVTAAETLNFTHAARELNISQPSVSQHIQELENHFGMPLFVRRGRILSLTDAGDTLLPMAREMVYLSIGIDEKMESLKGDVYGHLMVGCTTTPGRYILPPLLASFLQKHPKVEATCHVSTRRQAVEMLCEGHLHVALAGARDFDREIEYCRFMSEPILLIVPADHCWAEAGSIEAKELLEADFIMREEGSGTRATLAEGLDRVGMSLDQLHTVLTLGSSEAVALSVQQGIGVAFISRTVVERLVPEGVKVIAVADLDLAQDIYIGRQPRRPATTAQTAFWEFVTSPDNEALAAIQADGSRTPPSRLVTVEESP